MNTPYQSRCPHCGAIFRVDPEQLLGDQTARCGICFEVFRAAPLVEEIAVVEREQPPLYEKTVFLVEPFEIPDSGGADERSMAEFFAEAEAETSGPSGGGIRRPKSGLWAGLLFLLLLLLTGLTLSPWASGWVAERPGLSTPILVGGGLGALVIVLWVVWVGARIKRQRVAAESTSAEAPPPTEAEVEVGFDPDLRSRRQLRSGLLRGALLLVASMVAAGLLLGYGYLFRADLSATLVLRPMLERLCAVTGCDLPPLRDPQQFGLRQIYVGAHPQRSGYLLVQGRLYNGGGFRQPYPELLLAFFDLHGRDMAKFRFPPSEYLGTRIDPEVGIAPGESVPMTVEIEDPGPTAVNYKFDFR